MKTLTILLVSLLMGVSTVYGQTSNNDSTKVGPPYGMSKSNAYYLYLRYYQHDNYDRAMFYGRWVLKSTPKKIKGFDNYDLSANLDRFINIYSTYADSSTNLTAKAAYIDTVSQIYKKAFNILSQDEFNAYRWHLHLGRFYQKYSDFINNAKKKATKQYYAAYKLKPDSITQGNAYYLKVLIQNLKNRGTEQAKNKARAIIKNVRKYADSGLNDWLDNAQRDLFKSTGDRIAFLQKKVKNNPKDVEDLKKLRRIYKQQGNEDKVLKISKKLYELNPNYNNATTLANTALKNGRYAKAITYLNKAKGKTDDPSKLKVINLSLATAYLHQNELQKARTYARKAISIDPNWGKPYLDMASIYANAVKQCSADRKLTKDDRAVYWLVLDYLKKAKRNADKASVKNRANSQISLYSQFTPSSSDKFFKGWKDGETLKINGSLKPCYSWIDETTTVR